ncbi:hypothetical protein [Shimazuella kribbensis]|uniref:hypothetical protein n=1 Tax=Shimazuella kribbensis TaxID=139808 RepID=UPI00048BFAFD|nr:hypothetical protein [Shimazuella kribbensis]
MSPELEQVMNRLKTDLSFAASYLESPAMALKEYKLESNEYEALVARDTKALQLLGVSYKNVRAGESGSCYSNSCTN